MQEVSKDIFYSTVQTWEDVPFSQTEGWVLMQSGGNADSIRYYLDEQIGCAAHVKRCMGRTLLIIDTECLRYKQAKPAIISRFYEALTRTGADMIEVNSRRIYMPAFEVGIRQAGFLRPVGSFSYALTNIIDLTQPLAFNENWRRNIKQSNALGLTLQRINRPEDCDIRDFMRLYREMCTNKRLAIPFTEHTLRLLLSDEHFHLCFICRGDERLSAIIYHQAAKHAGLLYAANGHTANEQHAGFQLYKQLLETLAKEGIQTFDMEKMGASTHSTNAVFLFKQGIRGSLLPLCGEWSWYKHSWYGIGLYWVKKHLWKKTQA